MGAHKRSSLFKDDDFDICILEESLDRSYIEEREEQYINEYDTYCNGLNKTKGGKGYGHNDPKFTTLGYTFTEESKRKMSTSAKERAIREGKEVRSKISKKGWENGGEEYRKHMSDVRKGKRLKPLKISDDAVIKIRDRFNSIKEDMEIEAAQVNEERHNKNPSWKKTNSEMIFAKKYHKEYNLSDKGLYNIVAYKTRTEVLPSLCKS